MRTTVSFLIGCVLGATGVLMYVGQTTPPALAAPVAVSEVAPDAGKKVVAISTARLLVPVAGVQRADLKADFGDGRSGGRLHEGLDIRAPRGTPVLAVADGRIRKLFTSGAGGLTIYQYDTAEETCYYYAHLDRYAEGVREGMAVSQGDVIGYVGTSGNAPPDTPHLHFGITRLLPAKEWWKGTVIDPFPLLRGE